MVASGEQFRAQTFNHGTMYLRASLPSQLTIYGLLVKPTATNYRPLSNTGTAVSGVLLPALTLGNTAIFSEAWRRFQQITSGPSARLIIPIKEYKRWSSIGTANSGALFPVPLKESTTISSSL